MKLEVIQKIQNAVEVTKITRKIQVYPFNAGITRLPVTAFEAAGDILIGTGAGTYVRLPKSTDGYYLKIDDSDANKVVWADIGNIATRFACGRLTLESGVPISNSNQADKQTLYYTPYTGDLVSIYDGSSWVTHTFTERSLDISSLTASKLHDIFIYDNSGTLTLEALEWTNATTRATALAWQDGRLVKSGATTRLYLGTIYMDGSQYCQFVIDEGDPAKMFLWNYYNRIRLAVTQVETTATWSYDTATIRQARADVNNKIEFIIGVSEEMVEATFKQRLYTGGSGRSSFVYVGLDSIIANAAKAVYGNNYANNAAMRTVEEAKYLGFPGIGYHYFAALEMNTGGASSRYGTADGYKLAAIIMG